MPMVPTIGGRDHHVRVHHPGHPDREPPELPDGLVAPASLRVFRRERERADERHHARSEAEAFQPALRDVGAEWELLDAVPPAESPLEFPVAGEWALPPGAAVRSDGLHSARWEPTGVVQSESWLSELPDADDQVLHRAARAVRGGHHFVPWEPKNAAPEPAAAALAEARLVSLDLDFVAPGFESSVEFGHGAAHDYQAAGNSAVRRVRSAALRRDAVVRWDVGSAATHSAGCRVAYFPADAIRE
jgi:hypothetical protein